MAQILRFSNMDFVVVNAISGVSVASAPFEKDVNFYYKGSSVTAFLTACDSPEAARIFRMRIGDMIAAETPDVIEIDILTMQANDAVKTAQERWLIDNAPD